jgi:DNA-binding MurR/RpiR family transcriptional regulator
MTCRDTISVSERSSVTVHVDRNALPNGTWALLRNLTPRRREIIRPVLENPSTYVLLGLRGVSRKLKSDPATVLRTVQAMGFKRYRDFQQYLHEYTIAFSTSLEALEKGSERAKGTEGLIQASIKRDMDNLKQLQNTLDPGRVIAVAQKVYEARRILLIGGDMVTALVTYLDYNLAMLGLNVVRAVLPGEINHRVRTIGKQDVVIGISFGRGLRQTVEGLKEARENGAYCVAVSDTFISPVAKHADQFFLTPTEKLSFADSYVACMALFNVLLIACANVERRSTMALLKKVAQEQRSGYRWYYEEPHTPAPNNH